MADIERNEDVMEMAELQTEEDLEKVSGEVVDDYDDESGDGMAYVVGGLIGAAVTGAAYGVTKLVKAIKKKREEKKNNKLQEDFNKMQEENEAMKKQLEEVTAKIKENETSEESKEE